MGSSKSRDELDRLEHLVVAMEGLALDCARHHQERLERGPLARLEREPEVPLRPEPNPL